MARRDRAEDFKFFYRAEKMKKILLTSFIIFISAIAVFSQKSSFRNASEYLRRAEAHGFSGQVLIAENGKIMFNRAFGQANREQKIPNSPKTVFNVASFTKQFTAAAILRLEADGKLKTSDAVGQYLENVPADKADITIHRLLTHTSGLSRGGDGKRNSSNRDEAVANILQQKLSAKVGEKFIYSNSGYHLLAAVIEKVSGKTYPQYLAENLFKPAGLSGSGVYQDEKWKPDLVARSYNEWTKLPSFTEWNKVWNYGSGAVVSNASDLFKWLTALQANKILPQETTGKLFRQHAKADGDDTFYGYGWYLVKLKNGKTLIFHGGDNPGYHSEVRWYAEDNRIIIILSNYEMLEPDGAAVQKRIIAGNLNRILAGEEYKQPPAVIKISAPDSEKFEGEYQLPTGAKFKVWNNGSYLNIGAEGQESINAIAGYVGETAQKYSAANDLTEFILENVKNGSLENIKTRIEKSDYDFSIPFLAEQFKQFGEKFGKLKEIRVQGTTSFPWNENSYRTSVILQFEKGATDLFLGFENGKINDVTTETGRPFPLIMPLAPNAKNEFSTFEFLKSKTTGINFNGKNELRIKTDRADLVAEKML
jgi:CubicO group peptidase (beta-lactamase class C family)